MTSTNSWRASGFQLFLRLMLAVTFLAGIDGCTGAIQPMAEEGVIYPPDPPPSSWVSAVSFRLHDSVTVEFFDGREKRVFRASEGPRGESPWFRLTFNDSLPANLHVRLAVPGVEPVVVDYPMTFRRDAFYGVWIGISGFSGRRIIGAMEPRAYPVPAALQTTESDSLWIFWGGRERDCWTCPT